MAGQLLEATVRFDTTVLRDLQFSDLYFSSSACVLCSRLFKVTISL